MKWRRKKEKQVLWPNCPFKVITAFGFVWGEWDSVKWENTLYVSFSPKQFVFNLCINSGLLLITSLTGTWQEFQPDLIVKYRWPNFMVLHDFDRIALHWRAVRASLGSSLLRLFYIRKNCILKNYTLSISFLPCRCFWGFFNIICSGQLCLYFFRMSV